MATTPADNEASLGSEPITQDQVLSVFVDRQPRPTTLIAERLDADPAAVESALRDLKRKGVVDNHVRPGGSTLWFLVNQYSRF